MKYNGIPYPSKEDVQSGKFDYLAEGECGKVWRDRFLLDVDDDGNVIATPELQKIWDEKGERND